MVDFILESEKIRKQLSEEPPLEKNPMGLFRILLDDLKNPFGQKVGI